MYVLFCCRNRKIFIHNVVYLKFSSHTSPIILYLLLLFKWDGSEEAFLIFHSWRFVLSKSEILRIKIYSLISVLRFKSFLSFHTECYHNSSLYKALCTLSFMKKILCHLYYDDIETGQETLSGYNNFRMINKMRSTKKGFEKFPSFIPNNYFHSSCFTCLHMKLFRSFDQMIYVLSVSFYFTCCLN